MADLIRIIGFSAVSSILIFLGKDDYFFDLLKEAKILAEDFNPYTARLACFFIGILWAGLWLPIQYVIIKGKAKKKNISLKYLLAHNKKAYFSMVKAKVKCQGVSFNTRVFKPQKGFIGMWNKYVNKKTVLCLFNINGISDDFHYDTLQFETSKDSFQGMVGKSFKEKVLFIDFDLEKNDYDLTDSQKIKIGNLHFCSTIPIFNGNQSKVLAVLAVDSDTKLSFDAEQKKHWENHMIYYAAFIDKHSEL